MLHTGRELRCKFPLKPCALEEVCDHQISWDRTFTGTGHRVCNMHNLPSNIKVICCRAHGRAHRLETGSPHRARMHCRRNLCIQSAHLSQDHVPSCNLGDKVWPLVKLVSRVLFKVLWCALAVDIFFAFGSTPPCPLCPWSERLEAFRLIGSMSQRSVFAQFPY